VKTALRIAEYELAQKEGELLRASAPSDSEALSLYADSLWSVGLFDEADDVYAQALSINKESSRARSGWRARWRRARSSTRPLTEAQAAAAMARATARSTPRSAHLPAAAPLRRSATPTTTSSTCCRTRTAATRPRGRARR